MKKVFSLLMIAMVFAACSSDDDNANTNASLEGTWKRTAYKSQNAYDVNGNGVISNDIMQQTNCYQNETLVFNANGTGADISTSDADINLELVAGTTNQYQYTVNCVALGNTTAFTWNQSGNTVNITQSGFSFSGTQSGNEITFVVPNGFQIEVPQGNGTTTVTENLTIVYKKQ